MAAIRGRGRVGSRRNEESVAGSGGASSSIEIRRFFHFFLAAALANLGKLDEAQAETRFGLTLDPAFTIQRFRAGQENDNPISWQGRSEIFEGMRMAGVPEQ